MGLIDKSDVKTFLKITSTDQDTLIDVIVAKVNKFINTRINRTLDSTSYYEVYDGTGRSKLILNNYPIVSIALISEDIDIENRTYDDTIDQNLIVVNKNNGILEYVNGVWIKANKSIYIEYVAGYSSYPDDLKLVAIDLSCKKYYDVYEKRFGVNSKNIMQENITFDLSDLGKEDLKTLKLYRDISEKNGVEVSQFSEA